MDTPLWKSCEDPTGHKQEAYEQYFLIGDEEKPAGIFLVKHADGGFFVRVQRGWAHDPMIYEADDTGTQTIRVEYSTPA